MKERGTSEKQVADAIASIVIAVRGHYRRHQLSIDGRRELHARQTGHTHSDPQVVSQSM
jgi:hypothetical protein